MTNLPPKDAVCIEDGCTLDAVTLRPSEQEWFAVGLGMADIGVIFDADEWVCSIHARAESEVPI